MPNPKTQAGSAGLTAIVSDPGRALLAFDFDGVLSPIVADPAQAQAFPRVLLALADVGQRVGATAIITGRPVEFVTSREGFSGLQAIPAFTIYGQYGRERWSTESPEISALPQANGIAAAREELTRLLRQPGQLEGAWLEDKGSALAVHTRRAADPLGARAELTGPVSDLAQRHGLKFEPGKLVLEVRSPGVEKGDVLREFARDRDARSVLYAGDDLGDLSAFAAVDELRRSGIAGVKVCSGSPEAAEVADAADLVVDGPAGISDLLESLSQQIVQAHPAGA
ncbi:MAG: trehalose-phosphatase [Actinomycetota bacterium]